MHAIRLRAARLRAHPRSFIASLVAAALLSTAAACGGDSTTTTEPVTGSGLVYTLATVDAKGVPAQIGFNGGTVTVASGKLTLAADSTFIVSNALSTGVSTTIATLRGTYSRAGSTLTLKQQGNVSFLGTWSENAVSLAADPSLTIVGAAFTYTR